LADFSPDARILEQLRLDPDRIIAVFREPPSGALYHRTENLHFEDVVNAGSRDRDVQLVLLPRGSEGRATCDQRGGIIVPPRPIDALSLIAQADLVIGGGGTMTRESALLGTPTYTVFMGRPAAADAALMRLGLLHDLRPPGLPTFVKRRQPHRTVARTGRQEILSAIDHALASIT
jgi:predicted glycosyltransferase